MSADGMGDGGNRDRHDESFTDMEAVEPELVEIAPIRHGMVLAGRYAVEKILGRGGSGLVVRAHDRDLRVPVAIKILRAELAGQRMWTERLAREVRLARQIHHPNVCRVFDFEQADGRAFVVMELAGKGTLRDELRTGALAARPLAERIADARAVASALEAIHRAGIIHRDVSPQNLLRMSDGRLVVSDFGLAVDVSDSTSSVHGGTVAYMAPEVLRGGAATFASDIWGLGVVMHELVFGLKPRWSEDASPVMLPPKLRRLTPEERAVFATCRACTARDSADRLVREGEVARMLAERPRWWRRRWRLRPTAAWHPVMFAGALTLIAAAAVGGLWARRKTSDATGQAAKAQAPLIVPTGEAADWTDVSTVLAEVPERIVCTRLLPDKRTVRFVWGTPPRAEDIDVVTRTRVPSPLVPAAYAEGCPDLSPDGKRLVYQGHRSDGRPFAFLSDRPDGKDAVPVVQTAEPTVASEPAWLADAQTFAYDVDMTHVGVFATPAQRMYVLPDASLRPFVSMFRFVIGNRVFVTTQTQGGEVDVAGFLIPDLAEEARFRLADHGLDLTSDGRKLFYASRGLVQPGQVVEIDLARTRARRIGRVRDQLARFPKFTAAGLSFVSMRFQSNLFLQGADGEFAAITKHAYVFSAKHCAHDLIVTKRDGDRGIVERIDKHGRVIKVLSAGPVDSSGECSPDGRTWYYSSLDARPSVKRCNDGGCQELLHATAGFLSASPDGTRVAFIAFEKRGPIVEWIGAEGGPTHEVMETETACAPGWANAQTLWVSRRRGGGLVWTQVDADSGQEIGRTFPGSRDCADGRPDPASPVDRDLHIVRDETSQLRLLDRAHVPAD